MRILLLTQYFKPESVGAAIWIHELAIDLAASGHEVRVLTAFPNYPSGVVFDEYRRPGRNREVIDGLQVSRAWIYSTSAKSFRQRVLQFASFCISSFVVGIFDRFRPDVIYAILPPLPLGLTAIGLALLKRTKVVLNVQDIYPRAAIDMGILKNRHAIRFFEFLEKWIYAKADRLVVISEGFRADLLSKGVPESKLSIVKNWADPSFIRPGAKENSFRREINLNGQFAVMYSGGLTHNSELETLLSAAVELRKEPFLFVIVGDGVKKPELEGFVAEHELTNVLFKPFQPLERYPEVLLAADLNVVTLSPQAGSVSVPSKIFKQMAAGRPILAIAPKDSELDRMISDARCGLSISPGDTPRLVQVLRWASSHPSSLEEMGSRARSYLEEHHCRARCTADVETILRMTVKASNASSR
jgi:colanic acid biosynthesis glycosyl transferase WcaI